MSAATDQPTTHGEIFHVELRSSNPSGTREFMSHVFGWDFSETPHPAFHLISTPGGGEGHIGPIPEGDNGPSVTSYVLVEDLDATESAIEAAGGRSCDRGAEAPGQGSYLWFAAPGGERMVAWQHAEKV